MLIASSIIVEPGTPVAVTVSELGEARSVRFEFLNLGGAISNETLPVKGPSLTYLTPPVPEGGVYRIVVHALDGAGQEIEKGTTGFLSGTGKKRKKKGGKQKGGGKFAGAMEAVRGAFGAAPGSNDAMEVSEGPFGLSGPTLGHVGQSVTVTAENLWGCPAVEFSLVGCSGREDRAMIKTNGAKEVSWTTRVGDEDGIEWIIAKLIGPNGKTMDMSTHGMGVLPEGTNLTGVGSETREGGPGAGGGYDRGPGAGGGYDRGPGSGGGYDKGPGVGGGYDRGTGNGGGYDKGPGAGGGYDKGPGVGGGYIVAQAAGATQVNTPWRYKLSGLANMHSVTVELFGANGGMFRLFPRGRDTMEHAITPLAAGRTTVLLTGRDARMQPVAVVAGDIEVTVGGPGAGGGYDKGPGAGGGYDRGPGAGGGYDKGPGVGGGYDKGPGAGGGYDKGPGVGGGYDKGPGAGGGYDKGPGSGGGYVGGPGVGGGYDKGPGNGGGYQPMAVFAPIAPMDQNNKPPMARSGADGGPGSGGGYQPVVTPQADALADMIKAKEAELMNRILKK